MPKDEEEEDEAPVGLKDALPLEREVPEEKEEEEEEEVEGFEE